MTYEDKLQDRVSEHPMNKFAAMGDLSEMDNFGEQFAELLNALSTNVIIPTEDEDALKKWAYDHAQGERIYTDIDGELNIADVPSNASGPEDVDVRGVGGGLDGGFEPGEAVVYAGDGEYVSEPIEVDRDPITLSAGERKVVDVSEIATTEEFILESENGVDGGDYNDNDGGDGGDGVKGRLRIDLSKVDDEIEVVTASGQRGYNDGDSGESGEWSAGDGGRGGGSSAIVADGELVVEAQGGGGGGGGGARDGARNDYSGGDGGDGAGGANGGDGGYGNWHNADDGDDGRLVISDTEMVSIIEEDVAENPSAIIFD